MFFLFRIFEIIWKKDQKVLEVKLQRDGPMNKRKKRSIHNNVNLGNKSIDE